MNIDEQKHGAVTVIKPEGPLVEDDVVPFRQRVNEVRKSAMGRVVVDLSAVSFVDSRGLETLAELSDQMAESGQVLRLCAESETVREVLELTELAGRFEHYEDVNSAVRSFL